MRRIADHFFDAFRVRSSLSRSGRRSNQSNIIEMSFDLVRWDAIVQTRHGNDGAVIVILDYFTERFTAWLNRCGCLRSVVMLVEQMEEIVVFHELA